MSKGGITVKKILALTLALVLIVSSIATAALPENALTTQPEKSVYGVLRLEDTASFLKWLISDENVNPFMPLILSSKDSNDIIGAIEVFKAFANNTPLKSSAVLFGTNEKGDFFQAAFTVKDEAAASVKKITDGTAEDDDFVKILLGNENPLSFMLSSMLKTEKLADNVYRVDTGLFVKAVDEVVVISETLDGLKASLNALESSDNRLFSKVTRKFSDKDFSFIHIDYETLDKLDKDNNLDQADKMAKEAFDKPLNFELGFKSMADKFVFSIFANIQEALKAEHASKLTALKPVKGSNIKLSGSGNPLLSLGAYFRLSAMKEHKEAEDFWKELTRQAKVRFGITEQEFTDFFTGPVSMTVNDSVMFEGMKIPSIYISQTGSNASTGKIFERLTKSPHFQKLQDGLLQLDSSISPISCLVKNNGDSLGIDFADIANISSQPSVKPALKSLLEAEGISALWIDFEAVREWIMSDENGVLAMGLPMAKMMGYGEIAESVRDVLSAELSVPSVSFRAENNQTFIFEFANVKINPENGLFTKLVKVYQKFNK